jgi:CheY-like chemotaxis protein
VAASTQYAETETFGVRGRVRIVEGGVRGDPARGGTFERVLARGLAEAPTGRRILVVDADLASASVIARGLASGLAHCVVETVHDPRAAVMAASTHRPDAIVVDVAGRTELTLVRRLRAIPGGTHVVIVATTATDGAAEWRELRKAGVTSCYPKPVVVEDIVAALARAWRV